MKFLSASKISQLFKEKARVGQNLFPELVKKLIVASVNKPGYIRFPSGDLVWNAGFDGIITDVKTDSRFVPNGNSFWEMGTNANPLKKLNEDFTKRIADKKSTFVFCTPYLFTKPNEAIEWQKQNKKQKLWKDILLFDVIVLEDWLEEHIEIAFWLLKEFGENVPNNGIRLLQDEAQKIYELTKPNIINDFLVCSNTDNSKRLVDELTASTINRIVTIKSPISLEHGYFFTIGAIQSSNNESVKSRVIIAKNQEALEFIKTNYKEKIVILNFNCIDDELKISSNTYLYITTDTHKTALITLEQMRFRDYEKCLEDMGIDKIEAGKITSDLNRNISCFKRKYAVLETIKTPVWATKDNKTEIVPIALVSKFNSCCDGDCEVIAKLSGKTSQEYMEILDKWLLVDDSPIDKIKDTYFVNSKEEILAVLQLDMQSSKVKTLESLLADVLTTSNPKYKKEPAKWDFVDYKDEKAKYTTSLANGIMATFAILSKENNPSLDYHIKTIIEKMKNDVICLHSIVEHFPTLSEVSHKAVLEYIETAVDADDKIFRIVMEQTYGQLFQRTNMQYIIWSLHYCIQRKESAIQALRVYLKLYYANYSLPNGTNLESDVKTFFSPSTSGFVVAATPQEKYNILAMVSTGKDIAQTTKIIKKLKWNAIDSFGMPSVPRWKSVDKDEIAVTYTDMHEVNDLANKWLVENVTDKLSLIKELIDDISQNRKETNKNNFSIIEEQIKSLSKQDRNELHYFVIDEIYEIRHFSNSENDIWTYKAEFIPNLEKIYDLTIPDNLFDRYAYIFRHGMYHIPLLNPTPYEAGKTHCDDDAKNELVEKCIKELVKEYGEKIALRIIDECKDGFPFGKYLKEFFPNHLEAIKHMIKVSKLGLLCSFFYCIKSTEIIKLFEQLSKPEKEKIIQYLPYQEELFDYMEGTEFEKEYWTGRRPYWGNGCDSFFNKAFEKLLKYDPIMLIDWFAYHEKKADYDKQILLLQALANDLEKLAREREFDSLRTIIKNLDAQYYTDELTQVEFAFLPYFVRDLADYPLGIKKYIWNNPVAFAGIIDASVKCLDKPQTLGWYIACSLMTSFGDKCWIPIEYIVTQSEEFKKWVNAILEAKKTYEEKTNQFIDAAILHIVALQPENGVLWPSKDVADIIEKLAGNKLEEQKRVASSFSCGKTNSRGARFVGDGSAELKQYEKYMSFANKYRATHPTTAIALEYIAGNYKYDADMYKQQDITGWF